MLVLSLPHTIEHASLSVLRKFAHACISLFQKRAHGCLHVSVNRTYSCCVMSAVKTYMSVLPEFYPYPKTLITSCVFPLCQQHAHVRFFTCVKERGQLCYHYFKTWNELGCVIIGSDRCICFCCLFRCVTSLAHKLAHVLFIIISKQMRMFVCCCFFVLLLLLLFISVAIWVVLSYCSCSQLFATVNLDMMFSNYFNNLHMLLLYLWFNQWNSLHQPDDSVSAIRSNTSNFISRLRVCYVGSKHPTNCICYLLSFRCLVVCIASVCLAALNKIKCIYSVPITVSNALHMFLFVCCCCVHCFKHMNMFLIINSKTNMVLLYMLQRMHISFYTNFKASKNISCLPTITSNNWTCLFVIMVSKRIHFVFGC